MKRKNKIVKEWEWIVSLLIAIVGGTIIWTNETIDILVKFGWTTVNGGQAILVFLIITAFGLSWFLVNYLRHTKLI